MEKKMEQRIVTRTIVILVGMPCSGKTTYCKRNNISYVSRDDIREFHFRKPYIYLGENEKKVTNMFDKLVESYLEYNEVVTLDNTHCKEKYIDGIISKYKDIPITIHFFEISLVKAYYRNIIRYFQTGRWIPFRVINNMNKNFKQINRKKYTKYLSL